MTSTRSVSVDTGDQRRDNSPEVDHNSQPGRSKKWLWWLLGVVLVAGAAFGVWWFEFRTEPETSELTLETIQQMAEVSTGTFQTTVSAEGTVAAAETEELSFTSAGSVTAVNVEVGDVVRAGDVLATIDSSELEAALAEAQAEYDDLEAQLADDIEIDESEEQIELDEARLAVAEDQLENAEQALAGTELVAEIGGTVTAVNLTVGEELTSGGTGGTNLTGSESGSGNSSADIGSASNDPLGGADGASSSSAHFTVVSVGIYEVELSIDTTDIDSIEIGQEVTLTEATASSSGFGDFPGGGGFLFGGGGNPLGGAGAAGGGNPFGGGDNPFGDEGGAEVAGDAALATGDVTDISQIADASSGVASFTVTVEFVDENEEFYVGTTVIAEILTGERTDVVQVPSQAVTSGADGSTVTVAVDGTVEGTLETRVVTTGEISGNMTEITSGVEPGEVVVIEIEVPAGFQERFAEGDFPGGGQGFPGGGQGQPSQGSEG